MRLVVGQGDQEAETMNETILAMLLARIDRLERLLHSVYRHRDCKDEMEQLSHQLYAECREWMQDQSSYLEAAKRMIEETK